MTSSEFNQLIADGKLVPSKGSNSRFKASGASIGLIVEQIDTKKKKSVKTAKNAVKTQKEAPQLTKMKLWLTTLGIEFTPELQFAKPRKFRFDIAIESKMVAIEYEGIVAKKSRHTTKTGYTKDTEKYNLAAMKGWRVLRYTALNYNSLLKDLELI